MSALPRYVKFRTRQFYENPPHRSGPVLDRGTGQDLREFEMIAVQRRGFMAREVGERLIVVNDGP